MWARERLPETGELAVQALFEQAVVVSHGYCQSLNILIEHGCQAGACYPERHCRVITTASGRWTGHLWMIGFTRAFRLSNSLLRPENVQTVQP
jgi:hypothetical protein